MIKKVDVRLLKKGMYIAYFDRPWLETPFLLHHFLIRNDKQIFKIQKYCYHAYIDTTKGIDIPSSIPDKAVHEVAHDLHQELSPPTPLKELPPDKEFEPREIEEEFEAAKVIHQKTNELIVNVLDDVRMGKSVDSDGAKKVVGGLVASVMRNKDALLCLSQLKHKDQYTSYHSINVCILSLAFGRHMGLDKQQLNLLGVGGLLHDIGKMKIPDEVLNKHGPLSHEEFEVMKSHVVHSADVLRHAKHIRPESMEVVLSHHERYNGEGYPMGLKGSQISPFGLISSIVDVYDAITSDRVYRKGLLPSKALKMMFDWRGKDFHGALMERFIQCVGIYPIGSIVEINSGELAIVISINPARILKPKILLVRKEDGSSYSPSIIRDMNTPQYDHWQIIHVHPVGYHGIDTKTLLQNAGILYEESL